MFGPCFVMQYFVSFLVLQSSCPRKRESPLLYFTFLFAYMGLLVFRVSSSWYRGLVCSGFVIVAFPSHTHLFHQRVIVVITTKFLN